MARCFHDANGLNGELLLWPDPVRPMCGSAKASITGKKRFADVQERGKGMFKDLLTLVAAAKLWRTWLVAIALLSTPCSLSAQNPSPGIAHFVVRTDSKFDVYLNSPTSDLKAWFQSRVWRMMVYSPFFDTKLNWYPNGWVYINLYGLHTDWPVVSQHPEWLLRDSHNNPLYIPYDCSGGNCPLYAADVSNPQYRAYWISRARELLAKGYPGLWIDDVNLEFRVSDGFAHHVAPMDAATGSPMLYVDWKRYVAEFCETIRKEFPGTEILHNSIWYAGGPKRDSDPSVLRQLKSADYLNLERGVADRGLTGGEGEWSLNAFFQYVDRLHAQNKGVILDNTESLGEYGVAAYFLISSGSDGVGAHELNPDQWLAALGVDLGAPLGPRSWEGGLFRREYQRGVVLLNEPGAQPVTVMTCADCVRVDGTPALTVRLLPREGAILLRGSDRHGPDNQVAPSTRPLTHE